MYNGGRTSKRQRNYGGPRLDPARPRINTAPQTLQGDLSVKRDLFARDADRIGKILINVPKKLAYQRHRGRWGALVLGPQEYQASARISPLRGYRDLEYVRGELSASMTGALRTAVRAEVCGLVQRRDWFGLELSYPTYPEEREILEGALNRILGVEHQWSDDLPFVPIAAAKLDLLPNRQTLENTAPSLVMLNPARQVPLPKPAPVD